MNKIKILLSFAFILFGKMTLVQADYRLSPQINSNIRAGALAVGIKASAFDKVAKYYKKHFSTLGNKNYISFVDFSFPSTDERLFVVNLKTGKTSKFLVTHGKNSGANYATSFSNDAESNKSSLGLYIIADQYIGKHGPSVKLKGLENDSNIPDSLINGVTNGKNSNAEARAIVMHQANYASEDAIENNGGSRLGRSQGCPAVSPDDWKILRPALKGGSILLMYKLKTSSTQN